MTRHRSLIAAAGFLLVGGFFALSGVAANSAETSASAVLDAPLDLSVPRTIATPATKSVQLASAQPVAASLPPAQPIASESQSLPPISNTQKSLAESLSEEQPQVAQADSAAAAQPAAIADGSTTASANFASTPRAYDESAPADLTSAEMSAGRAEAGQRPSSRSGGLSFQGSSSGFDSEPAAPVILEKDWDSTPVGDWNRSEFERLSGSDRKAADVVSSLPSGSLLKPKAPMSFDEVLSADRSQQTVVYTDDVEGAKHSIPVGQIELDAPEYVDYDQANNMMYGRNRMTVRYGRFKLIADRMTIDTRLREIQAYGNVILSSSTDHVDAESMWINANTGEAVAYNSKGHSGEFYFIGDPFGPSDGRTDFRQLSKDEAYFKNASFTTCDFPVPHFRFRAQEFTIFYNDRIFAKNVVLYIREVPVMWLPYFTRSLKDQSPWGFAIGSDSRVGTYVRAWYDYYWSYYSPSKDDDDQMDRVSRMHALLGVDYMSDRGFGKRLELGYEFDRGRHRGNLNTYHVADSERDVAGDSGDRYLIDWWHRSAVTDELSFVADVDYQSDPDLFYDILDRIENVSFNRDRRVERHAGVGLEWTTDDFFAGIQTKMVERIGRDRFTDFSDPRDNDFDFDRVFNEEETLTFLVPPAIDQPAGNYVDPLSLPSKLDDGLSPDRYGKVSQKLPQLSFSSNRQRLYALPLWYHLDLQVFNNLDKGLNTVGTGDDAFVQGFDFYQSLTHLMKFSDRYTWTNKVGLGVGVAQRDDDSFNPNIPAGATFPFIDGAQVIDGVASGLTWVDRDTFLVGKRKFSLDNVDPFFVYGDIDSRFNARISEALTAWARYRFREGSKDSLGEFYNSMGNRKVLDDLYAFRLRQHWIEAGLDYTLLHPRLTLGLALGKNLQTGEDLNPNEQKQYANLFASWANNPQTLNITGGVTLQDRQMRDTSDPFEFTQRSLSLYTASTYTPIHGRYYGRVSAFQIFNQDEDPKYGTSTDDRDFDTRDETILDLTVGRKIGTKYLVELGLRQRTGNDDETETRVKIERDMHDLVAQLVLGLKSEELDDESEDTTSDGGPTVRFGVRFKQPNEKGLAPVPRAINVMRGGKVMAFENGN